MGYSTLTLGQGYAGVITDAATTSVQYGIDAHEMHVHRVILTVSAVNVSIDASHPITVALTQSWNAGTTFSAVPNMVQSAAITAAGVYTIGASATSGVLAPLLKVTLTVPTGGIATVDLTKRTYVSGDVAFNPQLIVGNSWTRAGDSVVATSGSNTDTLVLKTGGALGTAVQQIVQTYTDTNKTVTANWVRTDL